MSFKDGGIRRSDAGGETDATWISVRIGDCVDAAANARRKKITANNKFRIQREAFAQGEAA